MPEGCLYSLNSFTLYLSRKCARVCVRNLFTCSAHFFALSQYLVCLWLTRENWQLKKSEEEREGRKERNSIVISLPDSGFFPSSEFFKYLASFRYFEADFQFLRNSSFIKKVIIMFQYWNLFCNSLSAFWNVDNFFPGKDRFICLFHSLGCSHTGFSAFQLDT